MPYPLIDMLDLDDDMGDAGLNSGGVTTGQLAAAVVGLAPSNARYVTLGAEPGLTNEANLGALADGILFNDVTAGVGSLRPAVGADLPAHNHTGVQVGVGWLLSGGGAVIPTGIHGDQIPMPFAGNVIGYSILPDQSGSLTAAIWKDSYANYPPVVGDLVLTMTLTAAAKFPAGATAYQNITAIPFLAGDVFRLNVNSAATVQRATIGLLIERTI